MAESSGGGGGLQEELSKLKASEAAAKEENKNLREKMKEVVIRYKGLKNEYDKVKSNDSGAKLEQLEREKKEVIDKSIRVFKWAVTSSTAESSFPFTSPLGCFTALNSFSNF